MATLDTSMPTISVRELIAARKEQEAQAVKTGLFARIRPDSKYADQDKTTFPVALYADGEYIVHGGRGGRYRLSDVDLFYSNSNGEMFPVQKNKEINHG